ncbi:MAG: AMP-binding protein [Bacteroidales bacterium]|nr:AMP-binding protein [Bacteroidales bacterium]
MKREGKPTQHFFTYYNRTIVENWNAPALTDYNGTRSYTYGEMAAQMFKLQILLEQAGLGRGDKVVICSRNCANWAVSLLSIAANRGVVVSIMDAFAPADVESLTNHSDAKAMFVSQNVWKNLNPEHLSNVDLVLDTDDFQLLYARTERQQTAYDQYGALYRERYPRGLGREDIHLPTDNLDDLMIINYTSGTTGAPHGAMLTYRNISANVQYSQEEIPNHAGWTEVCMLPLAHMFGMTIEFLYQVAGGCHVYFLGKAPAAATLLKCYAETKPYMILTVPLVIEKIFHSKIFPALRQPKVKALWNTPILCKIVEKKIYNQLMNAFGGNLIWLITGGAALNAEVEKVLRRIKFPLVVGYGMTEAGPLVSYEHWYKQPVGSCGKVVTRNELIVNSPDPQHQVGEILFRGEHVMQGYYKNEEATKAAIDSDGWLHTGDLGLMDKQGNLYIKGRSKAMILTSGGQNIYPEELESKLGTLPGVGETVIVGRKGKLVALVYPDQAFDWKTTSVEEQMQKNLTAINMMVAKYEQIASIEVVSEPFAKTPKQSIRRFLYK